MNVRIIENPEKYFEFLGCDPIQNDWRIVRAFLYLTRRYRVEFRIKDRWITGEKITMDTEKSILGLYGRTVTKYSQNEIQVETGQKHPL